MTAAEIYESVTTGGASDLADLVSFLNQNAAWCLVGGFALNCYVEPLYTVEVDVVADARWIETSGLDVESFAPSAPLIWHRARRARSATSMLQVNLVVDPRYQSFIATAKRRNVLGEEVPVATLEEVLQGKVWAWQDAKRRLSKHKKDELDLIRIAEAYPQMQHLIPMEIVSQLGNQR
jgi:hypothetical protein